MTPHCKKPGCKFGPWKHRFCLLHWKQSKGYIFDLTRKVFVQAK